MMQFSELSLGDVVAVHTHYGEHSERATVIGLDARQSAGNKTVLIGWTTEEYSFNNGYGAVIVAPNTSYLPNASSFPYHAWISHQEITSKLGAAAPSPTKCHDFNEHAVANQPDGTFVCYGCRH